MRQIEAPRSFRGRSVAPPLQPRYKSPFDESIVVANQERILQRSPRYLPIKQGFNSVDTNFSVTPKKTVQNDQIALDNRNSKPRLMHKSQTDYMLLNEKEIESSGYVMKDGGEYLVKATPQKEEEEYILKNMSEYILQSNGKYKLRDSGQYLIRSNSEYLRNNSHSDHPFAPSSSETQRQSSKSDDIVIQRNMRNVQRDRNDSPSSDYSSLSSGQQSTSHKSATGLVLTRVVRVLEATPPQFLVVPQSYPTRSSSPTPTMVSSVATNTLPAPPNTGYGRRTKQRAKSRSVTNTERISTTNFEDAKSNTRHTLIQHHSSPDLFNGRRRSQISTKNISRSPSPNRLPRSVSPDPTSTTYMSSNYSRRHNSSPVASNYNNLSIVDHNHLSPLTAASSSDEQYQPPHLAPSPIKRLVRRTSLRSTSSAAPASGKSTTTTSSNRSPMKSPLKTNIHGLVYI